MNAWLFLSILFLSSNLLKGSRETPENLWQDKMEALRTLMVENGIEANGHPISTRMTGTNEFGVEFECDPEPLTVHQLRPQDIDVIAALGDSITAGNGGKADTVAGIAIEDRGISWSVGGDGTLDDTLTLTREHVLLPLPWLRPRCENAVAFRAATCLTDKSFRYFSCKDILRQFNPNIKGYSTGSGRSSENWFNGAVPGARARNIPDQAGTLIENIKNDAEVDFDNDWKIVTIFIGGNDLCALEQPDSSPEKYVEYIKEGLDILHSELPRTIVNIVEILEVYLLPQIPNGVGASAACPLAQRLFCGYVANADQTRIEFIKQQNKLYQEGVQELVASGRYDTKSDFTVAIQPFFRNTVLPYTEDDEIDATYFAPDCFHFSAKGHAMGAINLWNNMLEPEGEKATTWKISDLKCPTLSSPYIYTKKNSPLDSSGDEPTTLSPTTANVESTTEHHESTTTAAQPITTSATTKPADPVTCKTPKCTQYVPDWVIAVICVLVITVTFQAAATLLMFRKKSHKIGIDGNNFYSYGEKGTTEM